MVNVIRNDKVPQLLTHQHELSFMQASDYAEHAIDYFRFAILDHTDWMAVEIETGGIDGTIDLIRITRD